VRKEEKNVLVYADGRIEEVEHQLVGDRFIKAEVKSNGDVWHREFHCEPAFNSDDGPYTRVAVEQRFDLHRTAAQVAEWAAREREGTMRRVLQGLSMVHERPSDASSKVQE